MMKNERPPGLNGRIALADVPALASLTHACFDLATARQDRPEHIGVDIAMTRPVSRHGVRIVTPPDAIAPTGTWSLGTRAGDFLFVAGMRGIDPASNRLVNGDEARIRQGFINMQAIAASEGASLSDAVRIVVYVTDMTLLRPLVNKVQEELWSGGPYPPRTILEVARLNQDDIFEVEGTFYCPARQ
jgi:enamine deaminase RidA (YjgF/YER057c/UK114 family)